LVRTKSRFGENKVPTELEDDESLSTSASVAHGKRRVIVFVSNDAWFFVSHRLPIAVRAAKEGYDVHVIARGDAMAERIRVAGCRFHPWKVDPRGNNPRNEWRAFHHLGFLLRIIGPDVAHFITVKPVLYGGLWARWLKVPTVVYAISGLGAVFVGDEKRARLLRRVVLPIYGRALKHPHATVLFQNPSDRDTLIKLFPGLPASISMIRGSGVDLTAFQALQEPAEEPIVVTLAARLLRDKGIVEFVDAARLVIAELGSEKIRFRIAGGFGGAGNPAALDEADVEHLAADGAVKFFGPCTDIAMLYAGSHIVCLPSWREGLPKSLVEAAAAGRAVVTTDVPGCRDAIEPGITGILVPVSNAVALGDAILELARDSNTRQRMGAAGRLLAEREFDLHRIIDQHMKIYADLLNRY